MVTHRTTYQRHPIRSNINPTIGPAAAGDSVNESSSMLPHSDSNDLPSNSLVSIDRNPKPTCRSYI